MPRCKSLLFTYPPLTSAVESVLTTCLRRNHYLQFTAHFLGLDILGHFLGLDILLRMLLKRSPASIGAKLKECWVGGISPFRHTLRTRVSAPQARAHCPLACSASSCSAITSTAMQPSSAAHWGIGRRETRVRARRLRTPVHTVLDCCHCVAFHCTAAPHFI